MVWILEGEDWTGEFGWERNRRTLAAFLEFGGFAHFYGFRVVVYQIRGLPAEILGRTVLTLRAVSHKTFTAINVICGKRYYFHPS